MRSSRIALGVAVIAAAGLIAATAPSNAASTAGLSPLKTLSLEQSVVEKTHGWHRRCRKGWSDWHKHVRGVGRITCGTRRCFKNNWGGTSCRYY